MIKIRKVDKKISSYEEFKHLFDDKDVYIDFDIDAYTDEELKQIDIWFAEIQHENLPNKLENLNEADIYNYNLVSKNDIINEDKKEFFIDNKKILGKYIVIYPEFSIIKEENKNNFYRIVNNG